MHNNKSSNCMIEFSLNHWLQMSYLQCETIEGAHLNASQLSHANESSHIARCTFTGKWLRKYIYWSRNMLAGTLDSVSVVVAVVEAIVILSNGTQSIIKLIRIEWQMNVNYATSYLHQHGAFHHRHHCHRHHHHHHHHYHPIRSWLSSYQSTSTPSTSYYWTVYYSRKCFLCILACLAI